VPFDVRLDADAHSTKRRCEPNQLARWRNRYALVPDHGAVHLIITVVKRGNNRRGLQRLIVCEPYLWFCPIASHEETNHVLFVALHIRRKILDQDCDLFDLSRNLPSPSTDHAPSHFELRSRIPIDPPRAIRDLQLNNKRRQFDSASRGESIEHLKVF